MASNTSLTIPQVLHAFNIYESGNALAGISGDVTLPDLESMTETLSGPGIAGEIEAPVLGFFSSMTVEIPFAVIYGDYFRLMKFQKNCELMLRGSLVAPLAGARIEILSGVDTMERSSPSW